MTASQRERADRSPVSKLEILGWCMYDVADSAFTTVIVTVLYAIYFRQVVTGNASNADFLWGMANSASGIVVALCAPVLGAIADYSGARKKFLAASAAVIIVFTSSLYFVGPGMIAAGLVLYVIANVGFTGGGIFIDSFLPGISNESNVGKISGTKFALGYASGLVCLALCIPLADGLGKDATEEQVNVARFIPLVVAGYYAVTVIPTFLLLKDRSVARALAPGDDYVRVAFRELRHTMRHIGRYRELVKLLVAFLIYNDGINTVISFAAIYAATTVGFEPDEVITLFIVTNVIAVVGAFSFGFLADKIGQKRTIFISLVIWIAAVTVAYFSYTKATFWVVAALAGIGMGSAQSVTRSLVALFTPPDRAAEFFGFLGIAGKAISFLGVLVFGAISSMTGSQRPAILSIGIFFVVGIVLLSFVDERKGREAALAVHDEP